MTLVILLLIAKSAYAEPVTPAVEIEISRFVRLDLKMQPLLLPPWDQDPEDFARVTRSAGQYTGHATPLSEYQGGIIYLPLAYHRRELAHEIANDYLAHSTRRFACTNQRDGVAYRVANHWARAHGEPEVLESFIEQQERCGS